ELREEAIGGLIALCEETEDWAGKLHWLEQRLALKGGEEKKQIQREIADVLVKLERPAEARQAMEQALDLETADGWTSLADWLEEHKRHDEALVAYRKAWELDPQRTIVIAKEAVAAHKARDWDTALAKALAHLRDQRGTASAKRYQSLFPDVLAAKEPQDRATLLTGRPGDAESLE